MYTNIHSGDFEIIFNTKEAPGSNDSVFFLLEVACLALSEVSRQAHSKLSGGRTFEFVYARMMWGEYM